MQKDVNDLMHAMTGDLDVSLLVPNGVGMSAAGKSIKRFRGKDKVHRTPYLLFLTPCSVCDVFAVAVVTVLALHRLRALPKLSGIVRVTGPRALLHSAPALADEGAVQDIERKHILI